MLCMNPNKEKVVDIYDFKVHNIKGHEGKITKCTYNVEMRRKKKQNYTCPCPPYMSGIHITLATLYVE